MATLTIPDPVTLLPIPMPDGSKPRAWTSEHEDWTVMVVRLKRPGGKGVRVGMPTDGYLVRVHPEDEPDFCDIWHTSSQAKASIVVAILLEDPLDQDNRLRAFARPMWPCTTDGKCKYTGVGTVPYVWSGTDWQCPGCGGL